MRAELSASVEPSYEEELVIAALDTVDHVQVTDKVRSLIAARKLIAPSGRETLVRVGLAWSAYAGLAAAARIVDNPVLWAFAWFAMGWVIVGNAAMTHEAVHGHLFGSRRANRALGTLTTLTIFGNFSTYRAYHLEHHAKTARPGDPEGTPLSFGSRWLYLAVMLLGGVAVLVENTIYTVISVAGHPPKWVRNARQLRAIRLNAALLLGVVGLAAAGLVLLPTLTLEIWLIPVAVGIFVLLPLLLVPEHYGATGEGDVLSSTRTVRSNPVVRNLYWNNNFHAAHHLAPAVPYNRIAEVDELLAVNAPDPRWRLGSYVQFHVATITRLAYNRPKD